MIQAWIRAGCFEEADSLQSHTGMYRRHVDEGARPSPKWYTFILRTWIEANELERADAVYQTMQKLNNSGLFSDKLLASLTKELINTWRQSDHPDKERRVSFLEQF